MRMWKYAILTHLRRALKAGVLQSDFDAQELRTMLTTQYERHWWITYAQ
jgi:hypothetical protein